MFYNLKQKERNLPQICFPISTNAIAMPVQLSLLSLAFE